MSAQRPVVQKPEDIVKEQMVLCVLFDLKVKKLTHKDHGQMRVSCYEKTGDENPTGGILFWKGEAPAERTLPKDANICAAKYG